MRTQAPPEDTVERWLWDFILTTDLSHKLAPPAVPRFWENDPPERRLDTPGRPQELRILDRATKFPGAGALENVRRRTELFHRFVHHELQAAELMAWAILAFPATPPEFRRGLLAICQEELRHMGHYHDYLQVHGVAFGDFPVRDWFWERVPQSSSPAEFVAVMGMGLEGGNLDHSDRFAIWFRAVGDEEAATILETVCSDEIRHVRFGTHWFQVFTGGLDFDAWRAHLPKPLSPQIMRGKDLNRRDRLRGGLSEEFLDRLAEW